MMKWKLTKQNMDPEQEDIRKSLDILDQILSEYDCGEENSDNEVITNGLRDTQGLSNEDRKQKYVTEDSRGRERSKTADTSMERVKITMEKTEQALLKLQRTERSPEGRYALGIGKREPSKTSNIHSTSKESVKSKSLPQENRAPVKPVRKSLSSPNYRPVSLENILNRKDSCSNGKMNDKIPNGIVAVTPPPRPSKQLLYELHQHAPHCALRRHAGLLLQQQSPTLRKAESSRDNSPDSLTDEGQGFVTSTAKKRPSHPIRPSRSTSQTSTTSSNRSDVGRKSEWGENQRSPRVEPPPPPEVAAKILANLLNGKPSGSSPKHSSLSCLEDNQRIQMEVIKNSPRMGFNQDEEPHCHLPAVPKRSPLTRLSSTCSENGSCSSSPVPSNKTVSPTKKNRNSVAQDFGSSSPSRHKVSRHSSAPSQTGLFQYYIPIQTQNDNKAFLRSYQPIRKFPETNNANMNRNGGQNTILSIKTDSGIDESLGYSPNSSLEDPHLNGNFSVHTRDKIKIKPNIYLPTPPVPIPDYSDSEESEIMPTSMLDPGLVKTVSDRFDSDGFHQKQTSSSTSVSDDSLLTSSTALKKNNAKNREFYSVGKNGRMSGDSSYSDSDSLFSDDSLEADQAFRKRRGKRNAFQKDNLKTLEENITSDDSPDLQYSTGVNTGTNSLWSTSSFDYLPSHRVNVDRRPVPFGDKCDNFLIQVPTHAQSFEYCHDYSHSLRSSTNSSFKSHEKEMSNEVDTGNQLEKVKMLLRAGLIEKTTAPPPNFTPPPPARVRRHSIDSLWSSVSDKNASSIDDPADLESKSVSDDGLDSNTNPNSCPIIKPPRKNIPAKVNSFGVRPRAECQVPLSIDPPRLSLDARSGQPVIKLSANPLSRSALNILDDASENIVTFRKSDKAGIVVTSPKTHRPSSFVQARHTSITNLNYPDVLGFSSGMNNLMRSESSLLATDHKRMAKSLSPDPPDIHLKLKPKKNGLKKTMSALSDSFSKLKLPLGRQGSFDNLNSRPHLTQKQLLTKHEMLIQRKIDRQNLREDVLPSVTQRMPRVTSSGHYESNPSLNNVLSLSSSSPSPEILADRQQWPTSDTPATLPPNLSPTMLRKEKDLKRSTSLLFANKFFGKSESSSTSSPNNKKGFFQRFWKRKQYSLNSSK